jgi:hypothetical protein
MDAAFPLLSIQRVRPIMTFGAPALVWRPCYRLDRYYSRLYSGIRKSKTDFPNFWDLGPCLEDNQRVTYTYTVSADVIGLLSV